MADIKRIAEDFDPREVTVYYDADPIHSKRDYVLNMTVRRDWNGFNMQDLKQQMRLAGATNIIGCKRHAVARDYLDLAFDRKVKRYAGV